MGLLACGELALVGLFLWQGSSLGWIRWLSSASCNLLISRRPAYTYPMIVTGVQQSEKKLQGIWWPKLIFSMMSLPKVLLAKASLEANTDPWDKEVDSAAVGRAAKALYRGHMSRERWKIRAIFAINLIEVMKIKWDHTYGDFWKNIQLYARDKHIHGSFLFLINGLAW